MILYQVLSVVGLLQDEVDPMVSVMKVEKAPLESYADIGGLDAQIQEIKEAVELPLTHPELYEDIGIKLLRESFYMENLELGRHYLQRCAFFGVSYRMISKHLFNLSFSLFNYWV